MSSPYKIEAIKKSIFNAANLSGLSAVFLSYSIGSLLGTLAFIVAVIIGSFNKYKAVTHQDKIKHKKGLLKILDDPSLTAQILMLAAFINFIKAVYSGTTTTIPSEVLYFAVLAPAWFFGFLGDDALRRNDKANFSSKILSKRKPLWIKTFIYVTRNPVFYYILTNIFFSMAILLSPQGNNSDTMISIIGVLNIIAIITALFGLSYAFWKGIQMIRGKITPEQTNDGMINFVTVLINLEIGVMAFMQGLYWIVLSQLLFAVANIVCLYETRHALSKEHSS